MGFWNVYKRMLGHDERVLLKFIENLYNQGEISRAEADRRRKEVEEGLHKVLDFNVGDEEKDEEENEEEKESA